MRAVSRGHGAPGGSARATGVRSDARHGPGRAGSDRGDRRGDARRFDLRPGPDRLVRDRVGDPTTGRFRSRRRRQMIELPMAPVQPAARLVSLTVDERPVEVPEGSTVLDACTKLGIDTPTLCYGETLTPANACRICVVEMDGARALIPACSRTVEADMVISTDSVRVRHSRKMVIEFLASSVDLSITPAAQDYLQRYDAHPERYGPPAPPDAERDRKRTGHHETPDGQTAATVHAPTKIDNNLYVRDYSKCILCYKCVDACGEQYQNTFAITVAGRGS